MANTIPSSWMSYHKVDTLLANHIHRFLASLITESIAADYRPITVTMSKELVSDIYDYHQQMCTGYLHPRADSRKFLALKLATDWRAIHSSN